MLSRTYWLAVIAALVLQLAVACKAGDEPVPEVQADLTQGVRLLSESRPREAIGALLKARASGKAPEATWFLAQVHAALGEWDRAFLYLKEIRAERPDDPQALLGVARVYAAKRQGAEARKHAGRAAKLTPNAIEPLLLLAVLADSPAEAEQVRSKMEAWRKKQKERLRSGEPAELQLALGHLYTRKNDGTKARQAFARARDLKLKNVYRCIQEARILVALGALESAEQYLEAVTRQGPASAATWYQLASVALEVKHYAKADRAERAGTKALKADRKKSPDEIQVGLIRARVQLGLGQAAKAQQQLAALAASLSADIDPAKVELIRFWRAKALIATGQHAVAAGLLGAIRTEPLKLRARMALADVRVKTRKPDEAIALVDNILAEKPKLAVAYGLLAAARLQKGDAKGAEQACQKQVELEPKRVRARLCLGKALQAQGRPSDAEQAYQAALAVSPDSLPALRALVELALNGGKADRARAIVEQQLSRAPNSAPHRVFAGALYGRLGEDDRADAAFAQAQALEPGSPSIWISSGKFYLAHGQPERARKAFEQALTSDPEHMGALSQLGQLYLQGRQMDKGAEICRRILELDPNSVPALNNLALMYAERKQHLDEALTLAQEAYRRSGQAAAVADTLGWVHHQRGELDRALPYLETAANALKDDAKVHFHLGMTLLKLDKRSAAHRALAGALQLSSEFEGADRARAALRSLQ